MNIIPRPQHTAKTSQSAAIQRLARFMKVCYGNQKSFECKQQIAVATMSHFSIYIFLNPKCTRMNDFAFKFSKIFPGLYPGPFGREGDPSCIPPPARPYWERFIHFTPLALWSQNKV
jgi:hypothetical protein